MPTTTNNSNNSTGAVSSETTNTTNDNKPSPSTHNNSNEMVESSTSSLVECEHCGHMVPESNMATHKATCRRNETDNDEEEAGNGTSLLRQQQQQQQQLANGSLQIEDDEQRELESAAATPVHTNGEREESTNTNTADLVSNNRAALLSTDEPIQSSRNSNTSVDHNSNTYSIEQDEIISNIIGLNDRTISNDNSYNQGNNEEPSRPADYYLELDDDECWPCPCCTLLNPLSVRRCNACQYTRRGGESITETTSHFTTTRQDDEINDVGSTDEREFFEYGDARNEASGAGNSSNSIPDPPQISDEAGGGINGDDDVTIPVPPWIAMLADSLQQRTRGGDQGVTENAPSDMAPQDSSVNQQISNQREMATTTSDNNSAALQGSSTAPMVVDGTNIAESGGGMAAARSSSTMGIPGYPTTSVANYPQPSQQEQVANNSSSADTRTNPIDDRQHFDPRQSIRVVHESSNNGGGITTTLFLGNNTPRVHTLPSNMIPFVMMHPFFGIPIIPIQDFRGADEGSINALPTTTLHNLEKELPNNDSKKCPICLEDFKEGDERKMLPCLHGFHESCVDKWLRMNGSCPICKHAI